MLKLDRYLTGEFAQAIFATLVVLLIVSVGGAFTDVLEDIAKGKVPAGMMAVQLGLVVIKWLPLMLPLALMLGLMMGLGRLYRDSEMPVIASVGVGPRRLLKPLLLVAGPIVAVVGACSLWLGPWADRVSRQMINEASRSLVVAGLEPGAFTGLPNGNGVIYVGAMSGDGSRFERIFIYRDKPDRQNVTTSRSGRLTVAANGDRYLTLDDGFEVEGPKDGGLNYRLMRYQSNDVLLPASEDRYDPKSPQMLPTPQLLGDPRPEAAAQLHYRIAPPLLALAFALLAVPLARSSPRQARYGSMAIGFLAYLIGNNFMMMGTGWIEDGKIPAALGLWWLTLPLLAVSAWLYFRDGRVARRRRQAA